MSEFREWPPNKAILMANITCPYCGNALDAVRPGEKEHVIGRRFVPKGILDGQWNLIVQSCRPCNSEKADLEDDISIVSMHANAWGEYAVDDDRLRAEAERKRARSISRRTGKPVAAGESPIRIDGNLGGATLGFSFDMPPQADEDRLFELARYHVAAFFYLISFDESAKRGGAIPGEFCPLEAVRRSDWGHPHVRWFMNLTHDWDTRMHGIGADGFFKIAIRKSVTDEVWSWALEWNHNMRLCGLFGYPAQIEVIAQTIPELVMETLHEEPGRVLRYRKDQALSEADDTMFAPPPNTQGGT